MRPRSRAFTMIELLVVIAIIMILAALITPFVGRAIKQAKSVKCTSNLRQIGAALMNYLNDNRMRFQTYRGTGPIGERRDWTTVALPYIPNRDVFLCPARPAVYQSNAVRGITFPINYGMSNGIYNKIYTKIENPVKVGVVADADHDRFLTNEGTWGMCQVRKERVHSGKTAGLLFADWHAEMVKDVSVDMFLP